MTTLTILNYSYISNLATSLLHEFSYLHIRSFILKDYIMNASCISEAYYAATYIQSSNDVL